LGAAAIAVGVQQIQDLPFAMGILPLEPDGDVSRGLAERRIQYVR
jgi:hypothetical protein